MSRAAKKKADVEAKVLEWMRTAEEAALEAHDVMLAEAKARTEELERIGAHNRIRWLDKVQRGLGRFYPITDGRIELLVNQCMALIGAMTRDVCQPPHYGYDYRDKEKLELLIHRIERRIERQPKVTSGRQRADENRAAAAAWHGRVKPTIKKLIRAGEKNDSKIAERIVTDAIFARKHIVETRTVRAFVGEVRRELAKK
jgi:hypothetical protein